MKRLFLLFIVAIIAPGMLRAAKSPFPQLSSSGQDYYYSIFSHRASRVLKNNGVDSLITSVKLKDNDSLKWKFVLVKAHSNPDSSLLDTFKIVSKLNNSELFYKDYAYVGSGGNYIKNGSAYESVTAGTGTYNKIDRFATTTAGGGNTFVFKHYKADSGFIFQIWCVEAKSFVNMTNNTAPRYEICVYGANDDGGNPFSAVNSLDDFGAMYVGAPVCSTSDNPKWYQLQFVRGSRAITSAGENTNLTQATRIEQGDSTAQMFRMEGNYVDGFKVICMDANMEMKHDNAANRIILVAAGQGDLFLFVKTASPDYWQLKHVDKGSFINETANELCLYGTDDDAGNRILFIDGNYDPYLGAPILSTANDPKWHYLLNSRANRVLKFRGLDEQIYTETIADGGVKQDSQLFRFEGTYKDGFKIISKLGGELKYNSSNGRFTAVAAGDNTFKFEKSSNLTYGNDKWGIWHSESKGLNAHNTKTDEVTIYSLSDAGSVWGFIHVSRLLNITFDPAKGTLNKGSGLFVDSSEITIVATPKPHFGLQKWTINSKDTVTTGDTLQLKLDHDITLAANFAGNDTLLKTLTVTTADGKNRLFPDFNQLLSAQTARLPYGATSITIGAEVQHDLSSITGDTGTYMISADDVTYQIVVNAENGATKTYAIRVLRAPASASSDASLTVTANNGVNVEPLGDDSIKLSLPGDSSTITIAARVMSGAVFVGDTGTFKIAADKDSSLSITVLAPDYETVKTYAILVHHKSKNALLKSLAIYAGSATDGISLLSPAFAQDRVQYTATASKSLESVTIVAAAQSSYADIAGAGQKTLTGAADAFQITVTPEEGQPITYSITISYLNNDATLKSIVITDNNEAIIPINPTFDPNVIQYTAQTKKPSVTVIAAPNDNNARVDPARKTITLAEKNNQHTITVTAQDDETRKTYTVVITLGEEEETAVGALALGALTIFPNPVANGLLTVENGDLKAGDKVALYSLTGSLVATFEASAGAKTVINVAHLPKGAYIVKLGKRAAKVVVN
jgi:hypothetical protein